MDKGSPDTIAHLHMARDIVARMAGNSAHMNTRAVSLVTAAFVFSGLSEDPHWLIGVGGYVLILVFWMMGAKYLHLERCCVQLYDAVATGDRVKPFDLNYRPYEASVASVSVPHLSVIGGSDPLKFLPSQVQGWHGENSGGQILVR